MKAKRIGIGFILAWMVILLSTTHVYAGGLKDLFAKKLEAPVLISQHWYGDKAYIIEWKPVENAAYYEIEFHDKIVPIKECCYAVAANDNNYALGTITVCAVPDKKGYKKSDSKEITFNSYMPRYTDVGVNNIVDACLLSKEELMKLLKKKGVSIDIEEKGDDTTISFTEKDSNNSGLIRKKYRTIEYEYRKMSINGVTTNVCIFMTYSYDKSNNADPRTYFAKWDYNNDGDYYSKESELIPQKIYAKIFPYQNNWKISFFPELAQFAVMDFMDQVTD